MQAVLEGSIQHDGDRLRVTTRLLNVADGNPLWAARYDEAFSDIFTVQDVVAAQIWSALTPELVAGGTRTLRRYTRDALAYQLYLEARFHRLQLRTPTSIPQSLAKFEAAIKRDPEFALAHAGAAEVRAMLGVFGFVAPHDAFPQARRDAETAIRLAPQLGEAYAALGHVKSQYDHDWRGAAADFRRAIELNSAYAPAWQWYGILLGYAGRFEEAMAYMRKAQELEPSNATYSALLGMLLMYARRHDEAIAQLRGTLELDPELTTAHTYLTGALLRRALYERAEQQLSKANTAAPGSSGYRGQLYALTGRRAEAHAELRRLERLARERYVSAYDRATVHATLGDIERTFELLQRALDERAGLIAWLPWDPVFDALRADPRYERLLARLPVTDPVLRSGPIPAVAQNSP